MAAPPIASRVLVSIRVAATPARAFAVFTQNIGDWWVSNDLFLLTPRSPGRLAFIAPDSDGAGGRLVEQLTGGREFTVGDVRCWLPGERLVVGWRAATFGPDHVTEVEIRFEPAGAGARVTVEHRGWDTVPQDHVARHGFPLPLLLQRLGEHWRNGLAGLAEAIASRSSQTPCETPGDP